MDLFFSSLNSGSNGNCYYIGTSEEGVLLDAGISARETFQRLKKLNISPRQIRAIFISHEHSDHIHGLPSLAGKYHLPVYATPKTADQFRYRYANIPVQDLSPEVPVIIGGLSIVAFAKKHDAADPQSFLVSHKNLNVGVFTDIGKPCERVKRYFKKCDVAFLEANYDAGMLENGKYPRFLKDRIQSDVGHLSNEQALELFLSHRSENLSHLLLSHLSKENNHPDIVCNLFAPLAGNTKIIIAPRDTHTALYSVAVRKEAASRASTIITTQMKLF